MKHKEECFRGEAKHCEACCLLLGIDYEESPSSAGSLNPHSIWALWTEDGTEVVSFHLSKRDAEMEADRDTQENHHIAEYVLASAELVGENSQDQENQ